MPRSKTPVRVGQTVMFRPFENIYTMGEKIVGSTLLSKLMVYGTVVSINEPHRWFSVEWGKHKLRTSFHFSDIGPIEQTNKNRQHPKLVEIIN